MTERLIDRRVLITGATGFLGRRLAERLKQGGVEVHGVSRTARTGDGIHWWRSDLASPDAARDLLAAAQPDVVFHLAGDVRAVTDPEAILPTFHSLAVSTVHLLVAAQGRGDTRVVLAGSLTEPAGDAVASSPYAAAKLTGTVYGRLFHTLYGTPVTIARLAYVYGPDQPAHRLIPSVIRALRAGDPPRVSAGRLRADWIHADDVVDGLVAAAAEPRAIGTTVDLGTGNLTSVRDVVHKLVRLADGPRPVFGARQDRPREAFRAARVDRTAERIGWRAAIPLDDGLRRTWAWYEAGSGAQPHGGA